MNIYQQFNQLFTQPNRAVAQIIAKNGNGSYLARTTQAGNEVLLYGNGYSAGQTVYYDVGGGAILSVAPDLAVQDIGV